MVSVLNFKSPKLRLKLHLNPVFSSREHFWPLAEWTRMDLRIPDPESSQHICSVESAQLILAHPFQSINAERLISCVYANRRSSTFINNRASCALERFSLPKRFLRCEKFSWRSSYWKASWNFWLPNFERDLGGIWRLQGCQGWRAVRRTIRVLATNSNLNLVLTAKRSFVSRIIVGPFKGLIKLIIRTRETV